MATRASVDTSALLAAASPRDQYHNEAVASGRRFLASGGRWLGTTLVLAELHTHLLHRHGPARARAAISRLLDDPAYEWVDAPVPLLREAVSVWLDGFPDQRFSLTDAVTFAVMRRERIRAAFAFDQAFVKAGFELLR
ncbi:MAG: type II toxin-antitoxin system VapC family toxin [Gemmatimonadales bacterium]